MFEARLTHGQLIKKILDAVKDLVNEASWNCSQDGMALQAMDAAHISLVSAQLKSEAFNQYKCEKPLMLGMNLPNFFKLLKCAGNDDVITIKAPDECDKVTLLFEDKNDTETSEYELRLINLDNDYLGMEELDYTVNIEMPSLKFQRICRDLSQIGDQVTISCLKKGSVEHSRLVRFSIAGDLGTGSVSLSHSQEDDKPEEGVSIKVTDPICMAFSLKYLIQFSKAAPLAPRVKLSLKSGHPLSVSYGIKNDDDQGIGYLRFYLGQKCDDSEN